MARSRGRSDRARGLGPVATSVPVERSKPQLACGCGYQVGQMVTVVHTSTPCGRILWITWNDQLKQHIATVDWPKRTTGDPLIGGSRRLDQLTCQEHALAH